MRGFVVFLVLAAVFLAGLFVFAPVCGDSGDLLVSPLHQSLEKGHWERSVITSFDRVLGGVTGCLARIQERNRPWHMADYGRGMMGCWFGGFVMWIIFIVIIAVVVYLIIRITKQKETDTLMSETPRHILEKRYARGEISKEECDEIRKDLET